MRGLRGAADVSVIVPTFNRQELVRETLQSVMHQSFRGRVQIVVVDDGSTDSTVQVVRETLRDWPESLVICRENHGPSAARNVGMAAATAEFIQFLDSDDLLHPDKLMLQVEQLKRDTSIDYSVSDQVEFSGLMRFSATKATIDGGRSAAAFPGFLRRQHWNPHAPLYRAVRIKNCGPWREDMRLYEDWEWAIRLCLTGLEGRWIDAPLAAVRQHDGPRLGINTPQDAHKRIDGLRKFRGALLSMAASYPRRFRQSATALALWHVTSARDVWRATGDRSEARGALVRGFEFPQTVGSRSLLASAMAMDAIGIPVLCPRPRLPDSTSGRA